VRESGGTVYVFSALHVSGQQLGQVSGVAAILRYPLPDLDELELEYEAAMMEADEKEHENNSIASDDDETDEEAESLARVKEDMELMNF